MITSKELARMLGLSEAAVSLALNGKPGVSEKTRDAVLRAAKEYGYDFSRISERAYDKEFGKGTICLIFFMKHGAVVADTPFFSLLAQGIDSECRKEGYKLNVRYVYENERLREEFFGIAADNYKGVIFLGTEMTETDLQYLDILHYPTILLDSYFENTSHDSILINNAQGAFSATNFIMAKYRKQAGYLRSSYPIQNFSGRADGFYKAIRKNGLSPSKSIVHSLSPSVEGAYADMLEVLDRGDELARCYFADNDLIAAGALRAFTERGYAVPQQIAIIGFDNLPLCSYITPALTTVHVPKQYIGKIAAERLLQRIVEPDCPPVKIEINTTIIKRDSA